jgi:hypothetical protein
MSIAPLLANKFWKALRNFIHDHVMERADDD